MSQQNQSADLREGVKNMNLRPKLNTRQESLDLQNGDLVRAARLAMEHGVPLTVSPLEDSDQDNYGSNRQDQQQQQQQYQENINPLRQRSRTQRLADKFGGAVTASANSVSGVKRKSRRYSVSQMWSISAQQDFEVDDELSRAQRQLKDLKNKISVQSKRNFLLERDVRYLDSRIALLIQNRMGLEEVEVMQDDSVGAGNQAEGSDSVYFPDDKKKQLYGNLFFLLQSEPRLIAQLVKQLTLTEIDTLLQTVMFTLYGNQYDSREEHLLLTMFQSVLAHDIEQATDFGSLLRANTPVSRMMTTYTRRGPGQQYLKTVLFENIQQIVQNLDESLEIDPLKVYHQMINDAEVESGQSSSLSRQLSSEEASAHPQVQSVIKSRIAKLQSLAQQFVDTIIQQIDQVPYGIRWICKQIKVMVSRKFPTMSADHIASLIGGFFFLRYVNPAIVTPESYMIIDQKPSANPRRTLTLIAKLIQNLANKPTYSKESYMKSTNSFIDQNKDCILGFLSSLCDVEDFYESLEIDQYMTMSKKDLNINVSLNEIYNTHALFSQHLAEICKFGVQSSEVQPNKVSLNGSGDYGDDNDDISTKRLSMNREQSFQQSCQHLQSIIHDLGHVPKQLARKENKSIQLHLFARWENAPVLFPHMVDIMEERRRLGSSSQRHLLSRYKSKSGGSLSEADILYMDTRSLVVQIMRTLAWNAKHQADGRVLQNAGPSYQLLQIGNMPRSYSRDLVNIEQILDSASAQYRKDSSVRQKVQMVRHNLKLLQELYQYQGIDNSTGHPKLCRDVYEEFVSLSQFYLKVKSDYKSLESVYKTICDHNSFMRSQLESYKAYLQNVRIQAGSSSSSSGKYRQLSPASSYNAASRSSSLSGGASGKKAGNLLTRKVHSADGGKQQKMAPVKLYHAQLEKDGVLLESSVPDNRRPNIFFLITSPSPGSFLIGLHYKGREKPIVEVDLKLDDLLEKQQDNILKLDLEYVQLDVNKTLHLLNKHFIKR
ncbi:hypothetical protein MP228_003825 [Amoeboaphelidium protococcarum]|nr:hypothetical protein MP228_003825 [Amoeboaphelidium protococcarum]